VIQTVHPSFFYLPRGALPGSRVKMRGHLIAHRTPLSPRTMLFTNWSSANISCTPIQTLSGISLQWFDEIRYLGVHIIYNLLVLKFPLIGLNVRFIVLQTVFSAELDELLRKKLLYSFSVVNVSQYCYMAWKPVCLTSIRLLLLILSLTDFL